MIFLVPFAYVYDPALTLGASGKIPQAMDVVLAVLFLFAAMYMVSSALVGFDRIRLDLLERGAGDATVLALITGQPLAQWPALVVAILIVVRRVLAARATPSPKEAAQ